MYCQFFGRYYYTAIYPGAFFCGSHKFPYRSLLLSTTVLNDTGVFTVGIALIGVMVSDDAVDNAIVSANAITDYSYVNDRTDNDNVQLTRCVTGLGPSGTDDNSAVGGVFFNGNRIPDVGCGDSSSPIVRLQIANINNRAGIIQTVQCRTFSTAVEGIYTCIMMNSSIMSESIRFGVYFTGRSESLIYTYIYHITIFHLSTQLLQL